jgi:molybdate transport system regulatory protein
MFGTFFDKLSTYESIHMSHRVFTIEANVSLQREGELFIGSQQMRLLNQVLKDGSIHAAAKNLKMSYQHAWHLLDRVNRLSPVPIVVRQKGGKDGGGCSISPYGKKLMEAFEKRELEVVLFLDACNSELERCFF